MIFRKLLVFILTLIVLAGKTQERLVISGSAGNYYVIHNVQEKESLSSIGRIYGYSAKQLAQYNSLNPTSTLPIGAKLKIPLTADNFGMQAETNTGIALYHIAQKGDNLFKLSQQYYKVPLASLRTWNDLTSDLVKDGQAIIVGFFSGVSMNSSKSTEQENASNSVASSLNDKKPVVADKAPLKNPNVMDAAVDGPRTLQGEMKPLTDKELLLLGAAQASIQKPANNLPAPAASNEYILEDLGLSYKPVPGDEGYFSLFYEESTKSGEKISKSGDVGVFKSTSGVLDHKYYVLKNNVLPGTIVKITVPSKKSIYARVLGPVPETTQSSNMLLYMSNAAATALGMTESSFFVSINYYQ
jgi:LysM repeat protein